MSEIALQVENLSKQYRLGLLGTGTVSHDLNRLFARWRGKQDPTLQIGQENRLSEKEGEYVWALQDINFEVKKGEVLGIIGKNGAGKSTLLKLLSKVTAPTTGKIKAKGRIASLLEVGTGFHPELTGRENIFLNGAILGMHKPEIKAKLDEIVDFAGVAKYLDTPVKRYSSGMYVRLAFAVAAFLEPEILVVDEVLAVGDVEFQKKAIGKMKDVSQGQGRTVLFVSHNMGSIQNLCSSSIVLEQGKLRFLGNTDRAVSFYLKKDTLLMKLPIEQRMDRLGKADKIKIVDVSLVDLEGNQISNIYSGQTFYIKLYYKVKTKKLDFLKKLNPSISFKDKDGKPIILHHSRLNGKLFNVNKDSGYFSILIDNIRLVPNSYVLGVSLVSQGNEILDGLSSVFTIQVIEGNFYGTGEVPPSSHGTFLIDGIWQIVE